MGITLCQGEWHVISNQNVISVLWPFSRHFFTILFCFSSFLFCFVPFLTTFHFFPFLTTFYLFSFLTTFHLFPFFTTFFLSLSVLCYTHFWVHQQLVRLANLSFGQEMSEHSHDLAPKPSPIYLSTVESNSQSHFQPGIIYKESSRQYNHNPHNWSDHIYLTLIISFHELIL